MNGRDDQKLLIKEATDLVRLVGQDLALKRQGREFVALCPFHDDQRPSLTIVPQKQIYHCFVCKAGGDVFSWMMNYHKMDFRQALEHLAERAGMQLEPPRRSGRSDGREYVDGDAGGQRSSQRKSLLEANGLALGFYRSVLRHPEQGEEARQYIEQRRISQKMVEQFQIGCAPDSWDNLAATIRREGWDIGSFEAAGLIAPRTRGDGYYDRLRNRLVFPICDALGRPVAFGGRKLRPEDEPKYLNSPETPIFNKSATLFGLHLAKQAIIKTSVAVVVEGYTDVIACHQHGLTNVVATLGTALTGEHVAALRHYAEKVVLLFDADDAGQKAADHAVEVFLAGSFDVAIGVLPDGLDPADLLQRDDGVERWNETVSGATDALDWQFERVRQRFERAGTVAGREAVATDYLRSIAQLGVHRTSPIRRAQVVQRLAGMLHMSEQDVDRLLKQQQRLVRPARTAPTGGPERQDGQAAEDDLAQAAADPPSPAVRRAEQDLIGCLLHRRDGFGLTLGDGSTIGQAVTPAEFTSADHRRLYQMLLDGLSGDYELSFDELLADLASREEDELSRMAVEAHRQVEPGTDAADDRLDVLLVDAAKALVARRNELGAKLAKRELEASAARGDAHPNEEELIRQVTEQGRSSNPARILGAG